MPETWACIDCGINTAPGFSTDLELEQAFSGPIANPEVLQTVDDWSEIYTVKTAVWRAAGMDAFGGCLCIGCLESRLGKTLTPKDFLRKDYFNSLPGTERLLARRDGDERHPVISRVIFPMYKSDL